MKSKFAYIKNLFEWGNYQNLAEIFEIKHYQKYFTFGPHSHENVEINYVRSGKCYLEIGDKVIPFSKGDCMILYPDVNHYFFTTTENAVLVQLEFKMGIFPQMKPNLELKHDLLFLYQLLTHSQKLIKIRNNIVMNRLINKAVRELNDKKPNFEILTRLYLAELFVLISRELDNQLDFADKQNDQQTEAILQYIHTNYNHKINLEDFSKNMGVSSRYLRMNFKKKIGICPVAYLLEYRINKALELIKDQSLSIKEIAFDTGFTSQQYFSKKFKEYIGITPVDYRNNIFRKV
ncbi:MAG: AraC family transcriptional regulator [Bacteroidota bacterium]